MKALRFVTMLSACFSLSLLACGGQEPASTAPPAESTESVEQGVGFPPSCPAGDSVIYWLEDVTFCKAKCGTTNKPGQQATQYAACQSNIAGTKKLINTNHCTPGCNPAG
ncbi:hypothetical protein LXT21_37715 [Myxococcus sp. K38C18041901]|uniref:hypothetical protein n=1 Tax=Myxococcus guangdongensis TaxID=2906760 RepID=UPI0020A78983|nr:hypothetical protein [Myxococcus guangdongensis]MCP3064528.1 hypothetical protein [Myxococcus guangdongensis]